MSSVNKVVARYKDGRLIKGTTRDFVPGKPTFHLEVLDSNEIEEIQVEDLKAVFFVKNFDGKPDYEESRDFPPNPPASKGRKIAVAFTDGEILTGYTLAYDPRRPGFFMMPTDEMSNNDRVYVVRSAVAEVGIGTKADEILSRHIS